MKLMQRGLGTTCADWFLRCIGAMALTLLITYIWNLLTWDFYKVHITVDRSATVSPEPIEIHWVPSGYGQQNFIVKGVPTAKAISAFRAVGFETLPDNGLYPARSDVNQVTVILPRGTQHPIYPFRYVTIDERGYVTALRGWGSKDDNNANDFVLELEPDVLKRFAEELVKP